MLIAEGRLVAWDLEVPTPPTMDEAAEAATRYVGFDHHEFPTCFTCGIDRDDGLEIWPGKVAGSELVASPWAAPDGVAPSEAIFRQRSYGPHSTVREHGCRRATCRPIRSCSAAWRHGFSPLPAEGSFVSYAWSLGDDGRKSYAGTAITDEGGKVLAYARQTWIAIRQE